MLRVLALTIILLSAREAPGEWATRGVPKEGATGMECVVESPRQPLSDGYQTTWAQITVDRSTVRVSSASDLDPGFSDIGVLVDGEGLIPFDGVVDRKTALLRSTYGTVVEQFKRGLRVRVQLRFWPTWPATGVHATSLSLLGFTRAYEQLAICR